MSKCFVVLFLGLICVFSVSSCSSRGQKNVSNSALHFTLPPHPDFGLEPEMLMQSGGRSRAAGTVSAPAGEAPAGAAAPASALATEAPDSSTTESSTTDLNAQKVQAAAAHSQPLPFCYIVQARGDGIRSTQADCFPDRGISTSPLPPASTVDLMVPRGVGRVIEVYGYIPNDGESCAASATDFQQLPLNRIFQMGRVENVDTTPDEVNVLISISFPGIFRHIGISNQVRPACYSNLSPIIRSDSSPVNSPTLVQQGERFDLIGEVTHSSGDFQTNGAHYKMQSEVSNFSGDFQMSGSKYQLRQGAIHEAK